MLLVKKKKRIKPLSSIKLNFQLLIPDHMGSRSLRSRKLPPPPPPPVQVDQQNSRAKWTDSVIKVFADLLADQVKKGNWKKKSFAKKAWDEMTEDFYSRTGMSWDKEKLRSRYVAFRKLYLTAKSLLERDDFELDETTGDIIATDEVWDSYLKEHPDAETLRSSGCPIYKQLCIIFSRSATDENNDGKNGDLGSVGGSEMISCPDPMSALAEDSSMESGGAREGEVAGEQEKSSRKKRRKGRKGLEDHMADAILKMASASKLRAIALQRYSERFSITNCVKALDEIKGVDQGVYFAAIDLFNDKPIAREIFLSLQAGKRLMWLEGKCKIPGNSVSGGLGERE